MTYQERKSLSNIIMTVITTVVYFIIIYTKYNNGNFEGGDLAQVWATIVLVFIPVSIVSRIVLMIIFRIFAEIFDEVRGEKEDDRDLVDERDKLVSLKSNRISLGLFTFGFLGALVALSAGGPISLFFIILVSGGFLSDIASSISEIYFYRKGV